VILGVAPVLFVAAPLLLISAFSRRDSLGFGLVVTGVFAAAVIVLVALLEDRAGYVSLSTGLPLMVAGIGLLAWLFREEKEWRFIVVIVLLAGAGAAIPLSWHAMRHYEHQDQEQAFTRYLEHGESQEGTTSLGGYTVGYEPEAAMADFIDNRLKTTRTNHLDLGLDFPGDPNLAFEQFRRRRDFQRFDLLHFRGLVVDAAGRVALANDLFPDSKVLDIKKHVCGASGANAHAFSLLGRFAAKSRKRGRFPRKRVSWKLRVRYWQPPVSSS